MKQQYFFQKTIQTTILYYFTRNLYLWDESIKDEYYEKHK